jgi:hypothetical protein
MTCHLLHGTLHVLLSERGDIWERRLSLQFNALTSNEMAWPNPFRRRDANTRTCWGYTFQLTPDHLTAEQSRPLKYSYDTLAEECLDVLNEIVPFRPITTNSSADGSFQEVPSQEVKEKTPAFKAKRDLYLLLRDNVEKDEKLRQLWDEVNTVPDWVDWDQV